MEYVLIGGIASAALGRPRITRDIDVFLQPEDIARAVRALEQEGFETKEPELVWLYKASRRSVPVDVIFKSEGRHLS